MGGKPVAIVAASHIERLISIEQQIDKIYRTRPSGLAFRNTLLIAAHTAAFRASVFSSTAFAILVTLLGENMQQE